MDVRGRNLVTGLPKTVTVIFRGDGGGAEGADTADRGSGTLGAGEDAA